ncbi:hypothetical protein K470DRAFT_259180 [Piedraia hortae CBS 480.64]|uniref:Mechanosensitive ion channel protein n=1 Tax=Piedraia hortae CBS 480.64 TaxID=1314780 RepID=A0A6A7BVJ7_9PEZI|nr:hypothetical protein K470DRAFT_259180 [Piedraia hortae CBS 480.64]
MSNTTQQHRQVSREPSQGELSGDGRARDDATEDENLTNIMSPSTIMDNEQTLDDELQMLKVEREVSRREEDNTLSPWRTQDSSDLGLSRQRRKVEHVDEFDEATNPVHEKAQAYQSADTTPSRFGILVKKIHASNIFIRWITYIAPVTIILLIPLMLGTFLFKEATVGNVYLMWFMIWWEIVWLTLWAGRLLAKCLPFPVGLVTSIVTNNSKKWRDMGKQLELPATLFFWWLAIKVSFLPTMKNHQKPRDHNADPHIKNNEPRDWMKTMDKVLIAFFVGSVLNLFEKFIIQLIAISFHLRTYADRIEINKFQIASLVKAYKFSKEKIKADDAEFESPSTDGSGTRTPGRIVNDAAKTTKFAFTKFGDVAGKVAGDFTGRQTTSSSHPRQVVLTLLNDSSGAQVLARRLWRTFADGDTQNVSPANLLNAFDTDDEADAAFSMFDKDMNGDISMEELEAVCVEIGRERKSITASLKDLDSVVAKLDNIFMFIVFVVTVLVLMSLLWHSVAGGLNTAGSTILALSWLFSATAQEFLQSVVFVFVKHPFDVGDRVTIYGNTGDLGRGDDYFVKEISLLYTEFKKMQGHVVQAPNSYLNTLFILNQRRSGALAEAVSITIKYGTTLEQIEGLRDKLLEFVKSEKREYQDNILTELRDIVSAHSLNLNVVFFYKSNWQNEGLRLARRNKFISALMVSMQEMGIEGPYMRFPGMKQSFPVYLQNVPHVSVPGTGHSGTPDHPSGMNDLRDASSQSNDTPIVPRARGSTIQSTRSRAESLTQMTKRVDFSLGARSAATGDLFAGDLTRERARPRIPTIDRTATRDSADLARSTSRDLSRRSTSDGTVKASGRHRFYGKCPQGW